jgi:superfamily II DNA/RNA helicase
VGNSIVVVCTDVAARGLDIPSVATVIHYDVARSVDGFVHRSGLTAVSRDYENDEQIFVDDDEIIRIFGLESPNIHV